MWPSQAVDDGEELLRGYLLAVEDYPAEDVEMAVDCLVKGIAPGVKPNFRPNPAETGSECRRQMGLRLRREELDRKPALPPPDIQRTPESQARVRELMEATVTGLANETDDATAQAASKARWAKVNQHFAPPQDDDEMAARLGYVTGDADGAADAA